MAQRCFADTDTEIDLDGDVEEDELNPVKCRHNAIMYFKKAVSFFMPKKDMKWDDETGRGNPTMSEVVTKFCKFVQKKEVKKMGKESRVKRDFTLDEFRLIVKLLRSSDKSLVRNNVCSYLIFQYNLIGRIDDTAHTLVECLRPSTTYSFALECRLPWSKNVQEERDAPFQILVGSGDSHFCALLALSIHLETWIPSVSSSTKYLFTINGSADNSKKCVSKILMKYVRGSEEFKRLAVDMNVGSHSVRKCSL